jgi:uncharacterized membrane protein YkgB
MSLAFMGSGAMKIMTPYETLKANPGMEWANDFSATAIVGIGSVELLLSLGLLLSLFLSSLKKYAAVFAAGLAVVMVGAAITHLSRGEEIVPNVVFFVLTGAIAFARKDRLTSPKSH